jgi:hypothetical protein
MPGRANHTDQMVARTKVIEVAPHALALRAHVRQIVESPAFRGSKRSQEFLQFIVERALESHFDDLKERALGVELFGRAPSYDTGDDSIVRVTARDVRKRLAQFYAESGFDSEFRIELPPGSYIPEFRTSTTGFPDSVAQIEKTPGDSSTTTAPPVGRRRHILLSVLLVLGAAVLWSGLKLWKQNGLGADHVLPWSALTQQSKQIHVIFCDPDIVNVQRLMNYSVSLSDYANQHYWPNAAMTPEVQRVLQAVSFRGASVAEVDAGIALRIADIARSGKKFGMDTHTARSLRLTDFKTDDSFVLLGSPRSNPWFELFQDQLDFNFEFDSVRKAEFVRNKHPRNGEASVYVPTAEGWGTGQAYAIIALVNNATQGGKVLLLAGSNAEATEAAGRLVTNVDLFSGTLRSHGIDPRGSARRFEILLRVSTMAGSPNLFEMIACHQLPANVS